MKYLNPSLESIIRNVTEGTANDICTAVLENSRTFLKSSPVAKLRSDYNQNKDGFFVQMFHVFDDFEYQGRKINPDKTICGLFEEMDAIYYSVIVNAVSHAERLGSKTTISKADYLKQSLEFREKLTKTISLMQDASIWLDDLTKRQGFGNGLVTNAIRNKLAGYGITDVSSLPNDVKILGKNALRLYDSYVREQSIIYKE